MHTRTLILGAGISGLAAANFLPHQDYLILERDAQPGGWCKTIHQDGFTWDYSGHFFHFRHPDVEAYLRERMPDQEILTVERQSRVLYKQRWMDFPFQKNIHQLPHEEFLECLHDLYFRHEARHDALAESFKGMLYEKFGRGISEKFLIPYNEKLYACDLDRLDRDAMGRFFPHADLDDIIRNMRRADNRSYNATFTYPRGGAYEYVRALLRDLDPARLSTQEAVLRLDLEARCAHTSKGRRITYDQLISSAPFDKLLTMAGMPYDPKTLTSNKVLVFNLGFDAKGPRDVHWVYIPDPDVSFYRVGFYDNIFGDDRMSLYVELGAPTDAELDPNAARERALRELRALGIVTHQRLISHHHVVMDPAYVHITSRSREVVAQARHTLAQAGISSIGRYGGWTYCSIEDNIIEARELVQGAF